MDALQEVADKGWTDEAREFAAGALTALSDHQPDAERAVDADQRHVMMSCASAPPSVCVEMDLTGALWLTDQWDVQEIVKRIVNELQARGYTLWFDLLQ